MSYQLVLFLKICRCSNLHKFVNGIKILHDFSEQLCSQSLLLSTVCYWHIAKLLVWCSFCPCHLPKQHINSALFSNPAILRNENPSAKWDFFSDSAYWKPFFRSTPCPELHSRVKVRKWLHSWMEINIWKGIALSLSLALAIYTHKCFITTTD